MSSGNVLHALVGGGALLEGVGDEVLGFGLPADDVGDHADAVLEALVVDGLFVGHGRVHLVLLRGGVAAQRNGHDRDARALDLVDHVFGRVVGNEDDVGLELEQALDRGGREVARHRHRLQARQEALEFGPELLLPAREHAHDLVAGVELHEKVKGLVLEHGDTVHRVGNGDLAADLVGDRAGSPGIGRKRKQCAERSGADGGRAAVEDSHDLVFAANKQ